jgi:EAL domain-containing protein (putative c-di-GMP-specific phosphodiesterase class I)
MPQAEQTELMTPLTDYVLEEAIGQCAAWLARGLHITVAVNASARNLHDLRFPNRVAEILRRHGVDPGWLEIEITENTVMSDPVRSASVLGHLRAIGVNLAIDDFGTGYSSLANLRTLTIDRIKIDRSFVAGIDGSGGDLTIVRSIVELGRNLGLTTVAEGIETAEVLAIIRDLGCDEYQGFLASRALPADELEPLLMAGTVALETAPR